MQRTSQNYLLNLIKRTAVVLHPEETPAKNYSSLLKAIGDARVIMIGEASHGTTEFYKERAEITKLLIEQKGLNAIAVEGDWPDCYSINRYVRGEGDPDNPERALSRFTRFPRWMWRNEVVVDFIRWLRRYNDNLANPHNKVGFYGLDLYSLFQSAHEVIRYLEKVDPEAAVQARKSYSCFDRFRGSTQAYGYATAFGMSKTCREEVTQQLLALLQKSGEYMKKKGLDGDDFFYAQMNAKVVKNAEEYYRSMFTANTWNLRDKHMVETLQLLLDHLHQRHPDHPITKAAVWAHNSHVGDASFTEKQDRDETNIGELCRIKFGLENTYNIGFTTYAGTVSAADNWDAPRKTKKVRPGLPNSYEELFHNVGIPQFLLHFRSNNPSEVPIDKDLVTRLDGPLLERAIGVIYRPETERRSHYFNAHISRQFDTVIHIDETSALKALDTASVLEVAEEETFPFGV